MTNLLERAISTDDGDLAAQIIQDALGIESTTKWHLCVKFGTRSLRQCPISAASMIARSALSPSSPAPSTRR